MHRLCSFSPAALQGTKRVWRELLLDRVDSEAVQSFPAPLATSRFTLLPGPLELCWVPRVPSTASLRVGIVEGEGSKVS